MKKLRPTSSTDSGESPARPSDRAPERQPDDAASALGEPVRSRTPFVAQHKPLVERSFRALSPWRRSEDRKPGSFHLGQPEVQLADSGRDPPLVAGACKATRIEPLVTLVLPACVKDEDQRAASNVRKHRR